MLATCAAVGVGYASALIPVINAEALSVASGAVASVPRALITAVALAAGQTAGKVTIYYGALYGRRTVEARHESRDAGGTVMTETRLARLKRRMLTMFQSRRSSAAVTVTSAAVGLPPLLLVSAAAGAARMRITDFVVCCFAGRTVRFAAIAVPIAMATH